LDITSEGLEEMFEGDCADKCARKFPHMSMEGFAWADPGARNPIGLSENFVKPIFIIDPPPLTWRFLLHPMTDRVNKGLIDQNTFSTFQVQ
jgi:hypothetical protein